MYQIFSSNLNKVLEFHPIDLSPAYFQPKKLQPRKKLPLPPNFYSTFASKQHQRKNSSQRSFLKHTHTRTRTLEISDIIERQHCQFLERRKNMRKRHNNKAQKGCNLHHFLLLLCKFPFSFFYCVLFMTFFFSLFSIRNFRVSYACTNMYLVPVC